MNEFPRSSPISILLGCDTWPDVAGPLTSRVSFLTGRLDCSSQGQEGGVALEYRSYIHNVHWIYPFAPEKLSHSTDIQVRVLQGPPVSCWDLGLIPCNLKCFLRRLLCALLCILCKIWISSVFYVRFSTNMQRCMYSVVVRKSDCFSRSVVVRFPFISQLLNSTVPTGPGLSWLFRHYRKSGLWPSANSTNMHLITSPKGLGLEQGNRQRPSCPHLSWAPGFDAKPPLSTCCWALILQ